MSDSIRQVALYPAVASLAGVRFSPAARWPEPRDSRLCASRVHPRATSVPQRLARTAAVHPWRVVAVWGLILATSVVAIGSPFGLDATVTTGIVSAFLYPAEESLALLAEVGLHGPIALNALYAAAGLDIAIGIAVLLRYRMILTGLLQLAVMGTYTVLISRYLPEYWLHPYGPISKNIPFLVAVLILMAVSDKRRE